METYQNNFSTARSRDFYRGKSFVFAGEGVLGEHYINDQYRTDFVRINNVLLACKASHLSSDINKPIDFELDDQNNIIGIHSEYGDFVMAGLQSAPVKLEKISENPEDYHWFVWDNSENTWKDTGISAVAHVTQQELIDVSDGYFAKSEDLNRVEEIVNTIDDDYVSEEEIEAYATKEYVNERIPENITTIDIDDNILWFNKPHNSEE